METVVTGCFEGVKLNGSKIVRFGSIRNLYLLRLIGAANLVHGLNILLRRHRWNEGIEFGVRWRVVEVASIVSEHGIGVFGGPP